MKICGLGYVEELKMLVETFIGGLSCVKQVLMLIVQGWWLWQSWKEVHESEKNMKI